MANERGMTIHFMDGSKLQLNFPKQVKSDEAVSLRLEKMIGHHESFPVSLPPSDLCGRCDPPA